ncbi:protein of unknown function [Sporobacter termitidis DSM 10068]|uniref:Rv2525c-like glycoside hydrolase-like domain-containing protein n=1 Tax=Sporobacter termitidis DSM 10068 TaxID=1123282 RepID=A0A1M5ZJ66_9FIRM|nr:glycoside hydrolase domain-containing protein [Sporobacter termitidis]SHI24184.1 protein of unknown function [Sporobacter termitidis DSM 10068]
MTKGIDCASRITSTVAADLVRSGYNFACRYIAGTSKQMYAAEAQIISAAGLDILCVYETTADRPRGGAASGSADGAAALKAVQALGIPATGIIYFAADFDAKSTDMNNIESYLRAARAQTGAYEIGIYGETSVIDEMAVRGACKGFWQTCGWSAGKVSQYAQVYQSKVNQKAAGISVDFNELYVDPSAAGMWSYREEVKPVENKPSDWAASAVQKAIAQGLIGDEHGDLHLQDAVTMEHMLATLEKLGLLN